MTADSSPEKRMKEALGPDLGSDAVGASSAVVEGPRPNSRRWLVLAILAIVGLQVAALFVAPPFDPRPDHEFAFPESAILANFELPAPHVAFDPFPDSPPSHDLLTFDVTIPSSIFTGWLLMGVIIVLAFLLSRRVSVVPNRGQNALEYVYEGLANFATSLGGPGARRYVPIFVTFFIFILLGNWSGLLPFVGRTQQLRAPTSDVNVTIGLALVAFFMFHIEGVRHLGFRGYFGKFFSLRGFRDGVAAG
ncbi:MAG TPA: FoF1 ATP synthase subunit a, partial [Candidatus Caenarcaniphilales bacterium]|nr:FoF1 ATP synthase subunit a [Candidatus Caenarcaniphilales bacterium]